GRADRQSGHTDRRSAVRPVEKVEPRPPRYFRHRYAQRKALGPGRPPHSHGGRQNHPSLTHSPCRPRSAVSLTPRGFHAQILSGRIRFLLDCIRLSATFETRRGLFSCARKKGYAEESTRL